MSISTGAVSELAISQLNVPQELAADPVMFTFNPQAVTFLEPQVLIADPALFQYLPQAAGTNFPAQPRSVIYFDIPDFDIPSAWTVTIGGPIILFCGYTPAFQAFFVRMVNGNFAVWLGISQGVVLGLVRATDRARFLHNLGPPFASSFLP